MRHAPHFQRSFYFLVISDCRPFHDQMRKLYWVGGGYAARLFHFVLCFLLSRPRAGLANVQSSFFGLLATDTLNVRNNNNITLITILLYLVMDYVVFGWFWFWYELQCFCVLKVFSVSLHGD